MGKYLHFKILKPLMMLLVMSSFLVSCLPMKKETQCGSNEAFNATRRKCVPVVGASTTNTVFIQNKSPENSYTTSVIDSSTTHTVAVSDSYNYGYTLKWYLHYQDPNTNTTVSTLVAHNTASYTFNPTIQQAGQYVLEAILLDPDGVNQLDSVNWNVIVSNKVQPTLTNPSPNATAYSYANTITSENIQIYIDNPDSVSGFYQFTLDSTQDSYQSFNSSTTLTKNINPHALGIGIHTLEIKLMDSTISSMIDSYVWIINVVDPDLPIIQTANTLPPLNDTITIIDGTNFTSGGWLLSGTALTNLCILVDDANKDHTVGEDVDVEFFVSGNSIGNGSWTHYSDGTAAAAEIACLSNADLDAAQSYFNLTNPDVAESKSINVVTYRTGTTNQVESMTWNIVVRPKNIRPVISISGTTTSSSMGCVASTTVHYETCTMTQSVNHDVDAGDTSYDPNLDSEDTDNVVQLGITLDYDPDIVAEDDFQVYFKIKKVGDPSYEDMDGTSQYTFTDCQYSETDTSGTVGSGDKYVCDLRMDAFNASGSIEPGDYVVTAYIRDFGDGLGWGVSPKDSNILTWEIAVTEQQTTGTMQVGSFLAIAKNSADYTVGDSWWEAKNDCSTVADSTVFNVDPISETKCIKIYTAVKDLERDDFNISIEMSNGILGGYSTLSATSLVQRTNYEEWTQVVTYAEVPEWAVSGVLTTATIKVTVQDKPDGASTPICLTCDSATSSFTLTVNDINPKPTFSDYTGVAGAHFVDLTGHKVFAGMPFEINVATTDYSDASQYDGVNVEWQWAISTNGGGTWTAISNANTANQSSPKLVWTPNLLGITSGSTVDLRLCLGDDGTGNEIANCTTAPHDESIKEWNNITVYPAKMQLTSTATNNSSGNEIAQWYDDKGDADHTNDFIYTAYTSGTTIYVEKMGYDSNGVLETVHTLSFETEDSNAGFTPVPIYDLSITGIEGKSVLVAYGLIEDQTQTPQFRVRRIDTQNDKFSFNYCGFYVEDDIYATEHSTCTDLYDEDAASNQMGEIIHNSNVSYISTYSGELKITFNDLPAISAVPPPNTNKLDLPIINSLGNTVLYRFNGTTDFTSTPKIVGYCTAPACGSAAQTASALADAINNVAAETDADVVAIAKEYYALATAANMVIQGPNEFDTYNNIQKITPVVGQINVKSNGDWYLPYSDAAANMQLGVASGDKAHELKGLVSGTPPSHTALPSSGVNNQEIANIYNVNEDAIYIATKNSNANLDVHKVDVSANPLPLTASSTDVYTKGNYDTISNLSISSGFNDYIYVSNISSIISTSTYNLGLAVLDVDLRDSKGNIDVSAIGYEKYVEDIDKAYISADPNNEGVVIVGITSNNNNSAPNNAYLIKFDYSFDTVTYPVTGIGSTISFNFHEYSYPALNEVSIVQGGSVATTNIFQLDNKGYTDPTSVAEDLSKYSLFFAFHESDTGNKIRTGFFDIEEEAIMTDDEATPGNFPAIIGQ